MPYITIKEVCFDSLCKIYIEVDERFQLNLFPFLFDVANDPNKSEGFFSMFKGSKELHSVYKVSGHNVMHASKFQFEICNTSVTSLLNNFEIFGYKFVDRVYTHCIHGKTCHHVISTLLHKM